MKRNEGRRRWRKAAWEGETFIIAHISSAISGFSGQEHLRQAEPYEIVEEAFFFVQFLLLLFVCLRGSK